MRHTARISTPLDSIFFLAFLLLSAIAGDLCLHALLSLRKAPRRTNLWVALFLSFATRLHAVLVGIIMLLPAYGVWALAARLARQRRGPNFGLIFSGLLGGFLSGSIMVMEATYGEARTAPPMWFFGLFGDILPALCRLIGKGGACREIAPMEALIVDGFVYLPSLLVGLAPLLGLLVDYRFRPPGSPRDDATWFGRRTSLVALALWGSSILVGVTGLAHAVLDVNAQVTMGQGLSNSRALFRTYLVQGNVVAGTYFATLPFAVWGMRAVPAVFLAGIVFGAQTPRVLVTLGLSLALLGWVRRHAAERNVAAASEPIPYGPLVMGHRSRMVAWPLGAVLLLVSLSGYSAYEPGLPSVEPLEMRRIMGPPNCPGHPASLQRFARFSIGCAEAGIKSGARGGLTPKTAEALCAESGLRLCTNEEWTAACQGPAGHHYPTPAEEAPTSRLSGCPPALHLELHAWYPRSCVNSAGLYAMGGSLMEWVRDGRGGHVLKGTTEHTNGLASRCDLSMRLLFPEDYTNRLNYAFLGTRCCRDERQARSARKETSLSGVDADDATTLLVDPDLDDAGVR